MPPEDMFDIDKAADPKLLGGEEPTAEELAAEAAAKKAADDAAAAKAEAEGNAETDAAAKAAEEAGEVADPARDKQIPRARFDEVNTKLHEEREARAAAEAKLAALEAAKAAPAIDINALEKEYTTAIMGGEEDKAAELRSTINGELIRKASEQAFTRADQQAQKRESDRDYAYAYAQVVKDHPFLDVTTGNQEAIAEVVALRDTYCRQGMQAGQALTKAATLMAKVYAEPAADDPTNVLHLDPRKAAAIARNAAEANRQPASAAVAGAGNRAVATTPAPKTQEEYEKLPDAERVKLLA
ncbi:MAG: hypothetical protein V1879_05610 [Pseudomonadota bacterium]